jgi:hypothetical protein
MSTRAIAAKTRPTRAEAQKALEIGGVESMKKTVVDLGVR